MSVRARTAAKKIADTYKKWQNETPPTNGGLWYEKLIDFGEEVLDAEYQAIGDNIQKSRKLGGAKLLGLLAAIGGVSLALLTASQEIAIWTLQARGVRALEQIEDALKRAPP